jgi:hypothetical protein
MLGNLGMVEARAVAGAMLDASVEGGAAVQVCGQSQMAVL